MEQQVLKNPEVFPDAPVLEAALHESYPAYQELINNLPELQIELEWRYYNDGKSWLGKAVHKKKTVFWLSVWDKFFQIGFFFTEKTRVGIQELPIAPELKEQIKNAPIKGRLAGMPVRVTGVEQLDDVLSLIRYKKSLK